MSEYKFKVGDLVKITKGKDDLYYHAFTVGSIGSITQVYSDNKKVEIKVGTLRQILLAEHFEVLPHPESTTENTYSGLHIAIPYDVIRPMSLWKTFKDTKAVQALDTPIKKEKKMATKYYRVKQDLPDLEAGAILSNEHGEYQPVSDLWETKAADNADYESQWEDSIVEEASDWFERVYDVKVLGKVKYLVKDAAKQAYSELHKAGKDAK